MCATSSNAYCGYRLLRQQIYINPLITIIPGLFIFVTALSVNIISDGLKEAMEANS